MVCLGLQTAFRKIMGSASQLHTWLVMWHMVHSPVQSNIQQPRVCAAELLARAMHPTLTLVFTCYSTVLLSILCLG